MASRLVVSVKFTAFADWPYGAERLCPVCAWAYSRPPAKQPAVHITRCGAVEFADRAALVEILRVKSLSTDDAVVLPTVRHRHVLATAEWGNLAVDGLVARWDDSAAELLEDLIWLRGHAGASWVQLQQPVPPIEVLRRQSGDLWTRILQAWAQLAKWRTTPPLWAAMKILTNNYARAVAPATPAGTVR